MNINMQIGARIKSIRTLKNIKQSVLAKQVGLSIQTLSSIENGKSEITVSKIIRFAMALNISIDELIGAYTDHAKIQKEGLHPGAEPQKKEQLSHDETKLLRTKMIDLYEENMKILHRLISQLNPDQTEKG